MSEAVVLGDRTVGADHPAFLVAELSGNHNGDLERAIDTVRAAAEAGADAIKLQTYTPDTMTLDCDRADFVVPGTSPWAGRTLYDLYREAHTPWDWHESLFDVAHSAGLQVFSTPFDRTAVDFLAQLGVPAYKIASFELVDDGLLGYVSAVGKPLIVSTGMSSLEEIAHALSVIGSHGGAEIILLRCTSSYPAPEDSMNLRSIPLLAGAFGCPVGLSDHSLGTVAPLVAVAMGACLIEKHFTLSRDDGGVDSHFSLEPSEFRRLVDDVRAAERMMGQAQFGAGKVEEESKIFRRSLYVVADMERGEVFSEENVRSIRPGYGLPPRFLGAVLGQRAGRKIQRGTPFDWSLLSGD